LASARLVGVKMTVQYAELHCLTAFSFQRGASLPGELVKAAFRQRYAALAITDECSMAGIVRAYDKVKKGAECEGFKLIYGSEFQLEDGPKLVLLAQSQPGYAAICETITRARRVADKGKYRLCRADLFEPLREVCVLWIPRRRPEVEELAWLGDRYRGRLWIAAELHRAADDAEYLARLQEFGRRFAVPLVAAGDVHMHEAQRRGLQDALVAVRHGLPLTDCGARLHPNGERHLRATGDLARIYPAGLLRETLAVAERCDFKLSELKYDYPHELTPPGQSSTAYLRQLTEEGKRRRWPQGCPDRIAADIDKELALIAHKKYEAFFLTVYDIVRMARERGILCQGRGSAANSAVCYALGITEVDPEIHPLLIERFLSIERDEAPDIDVDFEHQRREEVIQYVYQKYGRARAAIAATVIHYQPRSALRDMGKAAGIGAEQIEAMAKSMAWWDRREEMPQRMREAGLDPDSPAVRRWLYLAETIEGLPRHLSQHVGGFVIAEQSLSQLVPVENAAMPDRTIIQWDKDDLESLGLLKVDVLALGMLSTLRRSFDLMRSFHGQGRPDVPCRMQDLPRDDPETYEMIRRAETVGVFQIESRAQMSMLPRLRPRHLYDLTVQIAIVRPGPIEGGMVHPYLKNRNHWERPPYYTPELAAVLDRTYGVPIFQEQVMKIVSVAAGFSPGRADHVRRSMAAWKRHGGLEHLEGEIKAGMKAKGYPAEFAEQIYQMILGFGSYGFPESHAASFALLAYASAWLKRHQPAIFTCALLNSQPMGFYPPSMLVADARRNGVEVRPVDVMASDWDCTLEPSREDAARPALRLGLRLVGGFSEAAARRIVAAREPSHFESVADLGQRAQLNRRDLNALARADALHALAGPRRAARWAALGVERLPGLLAGTFVRDIQQPSLPPAGEGAEVMADYASIGLSLRKHPAALLRERLTPLRVTRAAALGEKPEGSAVRVAGLVRFRQRPPAAKGVMFVSLEDETGVCNLVVWPKLVEAQRRALLAANFMVVTGRLQRQDSVVHVVADRIFDRSHWLGELPDQSRNFR
jgi:error-prone DNA polymerase